MFHGENGWFNEHEEKIMVVRVNKYDPGKGDMHNRQAVTPNLASDLRIEMVLNDTFVRIGGEATGCIDSSPGMSECYSIRKA